MNYEERTNFLNEINESLERTKKNFEEANKLREQNRKEMESINTALDELLK